jgi:predicted unusual protein kinase regulating ubiquinone biosynthesis (AarF/ABC1/UbiB family)
MHVQNLDSYTDLVRRTIKPSSQSVTRTNPTCGDTTPSESVATTGTSKVESDRAELAETAITRSTEECDIQGITFLDAGLCTRLSEVDQRNFLDLFEAVALGRGDEAGRLLLQRSKHCEPGHEWPTTCLDPLGFVKGVQEIVGKVSMDSFRLSKVQIGNVLQQIMLLVRRHNVELESNFTTLVISIVILEGVGRQLNPDLDIFQAALPVLLQANATTKIRLLRTAMERGGNAGARARGENGGAPHE